MDKESAKKLIRNTFQNSFNKIDFIYFIKNLLNQYDESKVFHLHGCYIPGSFKDYIKSYERIGTYTDPERKKIDILIVNLKRETTIDRARTAQRNFIARYLKERGEKDAGLIAFVSPQEEDWRFSFVKMEYKFKKTPKGDVKVKEEFTPAKRYSFLIGNDEPSHTAQSQLLPLLEQENAPVFEQIEKAFSVDKVTDQFYQEYIALFRNFKNVLSKQNVDMGQIINLSNKEEKLDNFVHQILIRIMFMYFVQKRGCFYGDKNFLLNYWHEYQNKYFGQNKFHSDWLNILTFEALSKPFFAYNDKSYLSKFNEILRGAPYLNGGLFQKNDLDEVGWQINDTLFNDMFEFFEKYNFTVIESSPIDVEVALDPEMLGNIYEMIVNATNSSKEGIFYTPKTEIFLMINKSLVEYLFQKTNIEKEKIYKFIFLEEKSQIIDEFSLHEREAILREIEEIKILDPACGSGHYLVCALDILSNLKKYLYLQEDKKYDLFEGKKKIIEVSIYGVDVIRWAAEIAKMRLWLNLFLEASEEQWTSTEPLLPSLSCKIRIGDSLVQSIGDKLIGLRTFKSSNALSKELERLKKEKLLLYQNQSNYQDVIYLEKNFLEKYLTVRRIEIQQEIQRKNVLINEYKSRHQEKLFGIKKEQQSFFEIKKLKLAEERNSFLKQLKEIDEYTSNIQNYIRENKEPPFIWDIAFAELFDDKEGKNGVDIVVANPPYIRHELITDPLKYFSKSKYKEKLSQQLKLDWNKYRESIIKIDKKSDLYVYFYLKSLQLLNSKGIMCFITSSSWLDVGYGKNLQEILLKRVPILGIYDNQAKRSFKHADVNTIIVLLGAPKNKEWLNNLKENVVRFIIFKRPFAKINFYNIFLEIEKENKRRENKDYKLYTVKQIELYEAGMEYGDKKGEKILGGGKYIGNKWGGKYLRAPEIYWKILEKSKGKLVRLGDIAEVRRGFTTGANEFFYVEDVTDKVDFLQIKSKINNIGNFNNIKDIKNVSLRIIYNKEANAYWLIEEEFLKPVIKSPRECKSILIKPEGFKHKVFMCHESKKELKETKAIEYIIWGERQKYHKRPTCKGREKWWNLKEPPLSDFLWVMTYRDRFFVLINQGILCDARFYDIYIHNKKFKEKVGFFLNSTLTLLFIELLARGYGGGGGPVDVKVYEVENLFILNPSIDIHIRNLDNYNVKSISQWFGFDYTKPIREQQPNPLPGRKATDNIIFDALGLSKEERNEVYWAVAELVQNRLNKAKSV